MDYRRIVVHGFFVAAAVLAAGDPPRALAYGPGDYDGDGHVDLYDYSVLLTCRTGPGLDFTNRHCQAFDFDDDSDVDLVDFAVFQTLFSGEQVKGAPTVSQWGMTVLVLSLLSGITVKFGRRQAAPAAAD